MRRYITPELIAALKATGISREELAAQAGISIHLLSRCMSNAPVSNSEMANAAIAALHALVGLPVAFSSVPPSGRQVTLEPAELRRPEFEHRRDLTPAQIEERYQQALADIRARRRVQDAA